MTAREKPTVFHMGGCRLKCWPGGKTEMWQGRRKLGVWWVSPLMAALHLTGEDLKRNARVAYRAWHATHGVAYVCPECGGDCEEVCTERRENT